MNRPIFRFIYGRGILTASNVNIYTVSYKYDNNNILQYPFGYISYPINTSKNIEYNFTSIQQLKRAISGISGITKDGAVPLDSGSDVYIIMVSQEIEAYKKIKILFLDWDKTVSIWKGPPDFKGVDYSRIEQHLLPPPPPP